MEIPLLDFPPEVVLHIAERLCPHCSGAASESTWSISTLYNFILTCRVIRDIARTVLYHAPFAKALWHNGRRGCTPRIALLLRTLIQSPHLAEYIIEADFKSTNDQWLWNLFRWGFEWDEGGHISDKESQLPEEDIACFEGEMRRLVFDKNGQPIDLSCNWLETEQNAIFQTVKYDCFSIEYLRMLFLAKARNLERVCDVRLCRHLRPKLELPYLTYLHFRGKKGYASASEAISYFLGAAPALETIHGENIDGTGLERGGFCHTNVTTVTFETSALSEKAFRNVMRGFPKLERLCYRAGKAYIAPHAPPTPQTPQQIAKSLLIRSDSLKYVEIELDDHEIYKLGDEPEVRTLADMEALETLVWTTHTRHQKWQRSEYTRLLVPVQEEGSD